MRRLTLILSLAVSTVAAVLSPATAGPGFPVPGPTVTPLPRGGVAPCTVMGTSGDDRLTGTPLPDVICGGEGNDVLEGLEGDDVLDGGEGADTATWESSPCCVSGDLAAGRATGELGTDQLVAIERLTGSQGADVLRGDDLANVVTGLASTDLLYGGEGDDTLLGGEGDDYLAGEGGANALDGGDGTDLCADATGTSCDPPNPPDAKDTRGLLDVARVDAALSADPRVWRVSLRRRTSSYRLWDEGYVVVSFDTEGGDGFELHAVVRWTRSRVGGLLIPEGQRRATGKLRARRAGRRGVVVRVPLSRLALHPERPYYRWSVRTIFTGAGCRPCFDAVPDAGGYPQPV